MRLWPASAAAAEKLANERVTPGRKSDPVVKLTASVPKKFTNTAAADELKVLWPEVYDGKFGVPKSGVQVESCVVAALPSASAPRIAVTGRQKLTTYFASHATIAASATARPIWANSRAF